MLQLVYISTARHQATPADLDAILGVSRRNNRLVGVTGLLVSGGRRFLQVLEGPDEAVIATYERITRDQRHFAVVELSRAAIDRRAFGDWEMAHETGGAVGEGGSLAATVEAMVAPLENKNLRAQFTGFAELSARAA